MGRPLDENARTRHPLHGIWYGMIHRCRFKSNTNYSRYGGRGIQVCERWNDFAAFLDDVGPRPNKAHSLDRIDVNGNYEPGNVRWATSAEQANNKRPRPMVCVLPEIAQISCRAHVAFREWMRSNGMSQAATARLFGLSSVSLYYWLTGRARPDHHHRILMERLCSIPAIDWLTDLERKIAFGELPAARIPLRLVSGS